MMETQDVGSFLDCVCQPDKHGTIHNLGEMNMAGTLPFADLWPDVPMAQEADIPDIYADSVAQIELHGANFVTTYFIWGRNGPYGLVHRVPVVRIIRPIAAIVGVGENVRRMQRRISDH